MFLSEPGRTGYDLNFSCFGFPVRVHPAFFIMPLLLGNGLITPAVNQGVGLLVVTGIFFVSILIHEIGHAVAFRYFGIPSRIVLYWMGGLAIPESSRAWGNRSNGALSQNQQIIVSFAGPAFGLALAVVFYGLVYLLGGKVVLLNEGFLPFFIPAFPEGSKYAGSGIVFMICFGGIMLNLFLNILNLAPIYPLDGGQIARQFMVKIDAYNGIRNSIILSLGCAILIAVFSLSSGDRFLAFFFGFMAWTNYQMLQQYNGPRW